MDASNLNYLIGSHLRQREEVKKIKGNTRQVGVKLGEFIEGWCFENEQNPEKIKGI